MVKSLDINLDDFIEEVMEEQENFAVEAMNEAQEEVGKEIVEELKATSPSGNRRTKKYRFSWKYKIEKTRLKNSLVIYNEQAGLTHLLEHGHLTANQYGKYRGRTKAQPHIKPAEEKAKNLILEKIQKKLEN